MDQDYGLDTDELKAKASELKVALLGNIAQVSLLRGDYAEAIRRCDSVLETQPSHTKSLFRKAKALNATSEWEEAEALLRRLLTVEPGNADAAAELNVAVTRRREYAQKQKSLFKNMFASEPAAPTPVSQN